MNLQNFEQQIDDKIVARGHAYYWEDSLMLADKTGFDYRFQVYGSDVYKVTVALGDGDEIVSSYCDCPYTYGPVCKHEVAVYYELRDFIDDESGEMIVPEEAQQDLAVVLNDLSKDQLVRIVNELASDDLILKNRLLLQYSKKRTGQELESFKSLVRAIVSKYVGREAFIAYRETGDFAGELGDCLIQVEDSEDALIALDLAFLLLEEAIEAFQYADDSDGDIGGLVDDTLEVIDRKVTDAIESEYDQRQALFEKLLLQCEHPVFEGWDDFRNVLLTICTYFAGNKENREMLIKKIESMIDEEKSQHYQHYQNETMTRLLFRMIEEYGTEEETDRFIQAHLHYSSFREQLIQRYITVEKYDQVIQLAICGEQGDKDYRGLVSKWKNYRYAAYKALSLHEEQQSLAKELFMAGDFEYYQELKRLAEDTQQFYVQLKQELQQKSDRQSRSLLQDLIVAENDVVEMMAFVQNNPEFIEQYADDLVDHYYDNIQSMYRAYIIRVADRASNRSAYREVCRMIGRYIKIVGEQHKQSIVDELRSSYRRKPAFIDELSKV